MRARSTAAKVAIAACAALAIAASIVFAATGARSAAAGSQPTVMSLTCASTANGLMRYASKPSDCSRGEVALNLTRTRVQTCVLSTRFRGVRAAASARSSGLLDAGATRRVPRASLCGRRTYGREQPLALPDLGPRYFCLATRAHRLHYVRRPSLCPRGQRVVVVPSAAKPVLSSGGNNGNIVANPDAATTDEDHATDIAVLANDTVPGPGNKAPLSVTGIDTTGTHGTVTLNSNQTVHYDPGSFYQSLNAGQTATDTFKYKATDGVHTSPPATVTVTITGVDDAPVLANVESTTLNYFEGTDPGPAITSTLTLSDGDNANMSGATVSIGTGFDSAHDALQFTNGSGIAGTYTSATGVLALSGSASKAAYQSALRSVRFFSGGGSTGNRTVSFKVNDGSHDSNTVSRTVHVDLKPTAVNDSNTQDEDTSAAIDVLANDQNADGGPLFVDSVTQGAHGSVTNNGSNVDYTPDANYCGSDSFTYTLNGGSTATVSVTVNCVDDPPVAVNDSATVTEDSGANTIDVLANDTDIDGGPKTIVSKTDGAGGTVAITNGGADLTYTPNANFCGSDSFTYTLNGGSTATVSVSVTCVNDPPVLDLNGGGAGQDASAAFVEDSGPVAVAPATTVSDVDNTTLQGATVTLTNHPDGAAESLAATTAGTSITASSYDSSTGVLTLSGSDTLANYQQVLQSVVYDNSSNTPDTTDRTVTFSVTDGTDVSNVPSSTVSVTAHNDPPTATDQSVSTNEDTALPITLSGTDPEGDSLTFTYDQPSHGTVTGFGSSVTYTPDANYNGPDSFTFTADDGNGGTDQGTISITVNPVNDPPVLDLNGGGAGQDASAAFVEDSGPVAVAPATTVSDVDNTTLQGATVTLTNHPDGAAESLAATTAGTSITASSYDSSTGVLTLSGSDTLANYQQVLQSVVYDNSSNTPDTTDRTVTFSVTDGTDVSNVPSSTVSVTAHNDPPTATDQSVSTNEDTALPITLSGTDPEGDSLTFTYDQPSHGTVSGFGASVTYTPDADYCGPDSFTFTADDGNGGTDQGTISITVNCVNDPPVVDLNGAGPGTGSTTTFNEVPTHDNSVAVAPSATVTDVDNANIANGTITLTNRPDGSAESLAVDTTGTSITASPYDSSTGTITLSGSDTKANYQQVFASLTYANTAAPPNAADRQIDVIVNDGTDPSATSTATVHVVPIDSPPALDLDSTNASSDSTTTFTEDTTPATLAPNAAVSDSDNANLASATLTLTNRPDGSAESLAVNTAGTSITASSYDSATGVLTLTGSDTVAHYQQVLQSATYSNSSNTPDTTDRSVTFVVNDGLLDSPTRTATVHVVATNDPPTLDLNGGAAGVNTTASWTEDGGPVTLANGALVGDPDNTTLASAQVTLSNHPDGAAESLSVNTSGTSITATAYNSATGVLSLTGTDTLANYQQVLRTVAYDSSSQNPTSTDRSVVFKVSDGSADSPDATATVTIHPVNDPPTVDMNGGTAGTDSSAAFTETSLPQFAGTGPVAIGPSATVGDVDNASLASATVTLTNHPDGSAESLAANTSGTSITALSYSSSTGVLSLSGSDTVAHYQQVLDSVTYNNTSNTPDPTNRSIDVKVNDGSADSTVVHSTVSVTPTNDQPTAGTDSFSGANRAVGNTSLVVDSPRGGTPDPAGPQKTVTGDIESNDSDPDGNSLSVVAASNVATTAGGTVDITSDGDFTYHPPVGCSHPTDSFTYTISDGQGGANGTNTGTVNLTVADCVWYVDASQGSNGNGTSGSPFNTLAASGGHGLAGAGGSGDDDSSGDKIFLYPGTYTGGLPLESNQQLFTKRSGLSVPDGGAGSVTLEAAAAGTDQINGGLVLASGNNVQGLDLGDASGPALSASAGIGTATVDDSTSGSINNTTGGAVDINGGGTLTASFTSVSSGATTGGTYGIRLGNLAGTFTASAGTLKNATTTDVDINGDNSGDTLAFTYGGTVSDTSGTAVSVAGQSGGTKQFNGNIGDSGGGVTLASNTGATINFAGGLQLSSGASSAFSASGGGTVSVTDPNAAGTAPDNTLASTTGTALNVQNTTIGNGDLNFTSVSSNGAADGINVANTSNSSGALNVTGPATGGTCTGANACSGGTIQNSTGDGVHLATVPGGASLNQMAVTSGGANGVSADTVANGLLLYNSQVLSNGNATGENGVDWHNVTGVSGLKNDTVSGSFSWNTQIDDNSGTLDLTATGDTFKDATNEDGLQLLSDGTASMRSNINNNTFTNNHGDAFQASAFDGAGDTSSPNITFTNNTITGSATTSIDGGVVISNGDSEQLKANVSNNTIKSTSVSDLILNPGPGSTSASGFDATANSNAIGDTTSVDSGSVDGDGIEFKAAGAGNSHAAIDNNIVKGWNQNGLLIRAGGATQSGTSAQVTATGNQISNPDPTHNFAGIWVESGTASTDAMVMCADVGGASALANTVSGVSANAAAEFAMSLRFAGSVLQAPGYTPTGTLAGRQTYFTGRNSLSGSAPLYAEDGSFDMQSHAGGCTQPTAPTLPTAAP